MQTKVQRGTGSLTDSLTVLVAGTAPRPATELEGRTALAAAAARAVLFAAMVAGLTAGGLLALALAGPLPGDAELTRLLRGMVLIKGAIALAGSALVFTRLRRPVTRRAVAGYAAGFALTFASLGWLWGLSGLLIGSLVFYAGLAVVIFSAARDPLLAPGARPSPRARSDGSRRPPPSERR